MRPPKTPIVYPALLSRVAQAFRERIPITDRIKDGLTFKDAFDGREAVDKIAYIIKTTDRNLALLLGLALDAQKFFHDVTYDHRLRDSSNELYQFRTKLPSPFVGGEMKNGQEGVSISNTSIDFGMKLIEGIYDPPKLPTSPKRDSLSSSSDVIDLPSGVFTLLTKCYSPTCSRHQLCYSFACPRRLKQQALRNMKLQPGLSKQLSSESDKIFLPSGVFTPLTNCYSPTCSRHQLCYSFACPRRLKQQALRNMKLQPGLSKQASKDSLNDMTDNVNSVSDTEKKRQEVIKEVINTERDFVRDMEYLRDVWMNRLKEEDIIPQAKRADFVGQVFWNVLDIIAVNTRLSDALTKRQESHAVVDGIGDIFLEFVPQFGPFVEYGAHHLYGKYEYEKEKNSNPTFAHFVEVTERLPESRKLELNAYLTKPTARLAKYPLVLGAVLKHTPDESPDKHVLEQVISLVRDFLWKVNTESGKTENRFNLVKLNQQLWFKPGEEVDLRLMDEGRELIYKGEMNLNKLEPEGKIQVHLFDHALLFTKFVKTNHLERYKVYRRPIPLELLLITAPLEESIENGTARSPREPQSLVRRPSFNKMLGVEPKGQDWINFIHLGRKRYNLVLWAGTPMRHERWLKAIYKQQQVMSDRSMIFDIVTLSEGFFVGHKVNCAAPYGGRRIVYGTDDGVYLSDLREPRQEPVKVLALLDVIQVDILEDYQLLIVLSERQVITFPMDALDPLDPKAGLKRAKRISSHTSFFKAGFCLDKVLVCIVKSSQLSSTFKTLEPIDQNIRGCAKPTFKKLLQGGNDTLKLFREFHIPVESTSIHYLKTKMCVGCSRGFEIVDLESLDTQGLLDLNDESLEFVREWENLLPMVIYCILDEYLLCYDEFAFYVDKKGRRSRKDFMVHWEGTPTGFALNEPYVIAVEPSFVEIRHIETGVISQVIQGSNLRLLFADTSVSHPYQPTAHYHPNGEPAHAHADPYQRRPQQGVGRVEVLLLSDDRVLSLQRRGLGGGQTL